MTEEEYDKALKDIETDRQRAKTSLDREYAARNGVAQIGDIIESHGVTIEVRQRQLHYGYGRDYPSLRYEGPRLTKSLKLFKSCEWAELFGTNKITLLKKGGLS